MTFDTLPPLNRYANEQEREQWYESIRQRINFFLTGVETAGSIRYNSGTNKHQGYDGSTWNDLY